VSRAYLRLAVAAFAGVALAAGVASAALAAAPLTATPTPSPTATAGPSSTSVSVTIPGSTTGGGGTGSGGGGTTHTPPPAAAPVVPSTPAVTTNVLTLNSRSYRPDDVMIATGKGFRADEKVRFVFYPGPLIVGDFVANAKGTVVAHIVLSTSLRSGGHLVEAFGWTSHRIAAASFSVNAKAGVGAPNPPWIIWVIGSLAVLGTAITIAILGFGKIAALAGATAVKAGTP
jgi:hypothetical protein